MIMLTSCLLLSSTACTVKKTEDGEAPKVDVDPGKMPEYDVDPAKVEVKQDTHTVVTPSVTVTPDTTHKQ
jgi:hypothetical protein